MVNLDNVDFDSIQLFTNFYQGELDECYIEEAYWKDGTLMSDDDIQDLESQIPDYIWEKGYESAIERIDFND